MGLKFSRSRPVRVAAWIDSITRPRPMVRTGLRSALVISLALHLIVSPLAPQGDLSTGQLKKKESQYMKKIDAAKSTRHVAEMLTKKENMRLPPPDPEAVAETMLKESITDDLSKVMSVLEVNLHSDLMGKVEASLKDDIAEASRKIAKKEITEEEFKQIQKNLTKKAYSEASRWQVEHRETKQDDIAKVGITEWFDSQCAKTLQDKIRWELFKPGESGNNRRVWHDTYNTRWGFLNNDIDPFIFIIQRRLGPLITGRFCGYSDVREEFHATVKEHGFFELPGWPKPDKEQARGLAVLLHKIYDGATLSPPARPGADNLSWDAAFQSYLKHIYPHRLSYMNANFGEKLTALWNKSFQNAEAYKKALDEGGPEASLAAAQKACFESIKAIHILASEVLVKKTSDYIAVNQSVRSRVLRGPEREKMYKHFVDTLIECIAPAVRDMVEGQFQQGMIVRKAGTDDAAKELADMIAVLLRRAIEGALPKERFNDLVFTTQDNPYKSSVISENSPPDAEQIKKDEDALERILSEWPDADKAYAEERAKMLSNKFKGAIDDVVKNLVPLVVVNGALWKGFLAQAGTVNLANSFQEKLDARASALAGRGQDLAKLTASGVPDTSAALTALSLGVEPTMTLMQPGYITRWHAATAVRASRPIFPPSPAKNRGEEQVDKLKIWPKFAEPTPNFECIPFLANFPNMDGELYSNWGKIRPLVLKDLNEKNNKEPIVLYAAWNYQGFFFGYHVNQPKSKFCWPSDYSSQANGPPTNWVTKGDSLRLFFDTLNARNKNRGEPHTQEFIIFPCGTESDPTIPGAERIIATQRDAVSANNVQGKINSVIKTFPGQPNEGPDGTGPYRITKVTEDGYTVQVFLPRSLFKVPVFAPGWCLGFDCTVATGLQHFAGANCFFGQYWAYRGNARCLDDMYAKEDGTKPNKWGDLLLLGTDPRFVIQEADLAGNVTEGIVPGHSYLLTVIDPDRNVNLSVEDTVLVSAEVNAGKDDVELYILKETGKNTGVFRGYIDTQPGLGSQVPKVMEVSPGNEVRFRYVAFANSKGIRNTVFEIKLPVVLLMLMSSTNSAAPEILGETQP